ncbi:MAG: GNAT family N-acetyltransferase [Nitrospirota bacterium]|nr:GNAT family N-acetyltransferase [Nitrospirota bacterium]
MTDPVIVRRVTWAEARKELSYIRRVVFMDEQQVPPELEWDGQDTTAVHVLAEAGGDPVGCGRLLMSGDTAKIGRMAVLKPFRAKGIGARLLTELLTAARQAGARTAALSAQVHALPFYEKFGFVAHGPEYPDAGIPHRNMTRPLAD